jgi:hypothetical protein
MGNNEFQPVTDVNQPAQTFPPLRVHHLLLWMTVTAIWVELQRNAFHEIDDYAAVFGPQVRVTAETIGGILVASVEITICMIGALSRVRGNHFPIQPGHWIALFIATFTIASTAISALVNDTDLSTYWLTEGITAATWACVFFAVAKRSSDTTSWKSVFLSLGVVLAVAAIDASLLSFYGLERLPLFATQIAGGFGICAGVILLLSLVVAMATDRLFSIRRDWAHCTAIAVPLGFGFAWVSSIIIEKLGLWPSA